MSALHAMVMNALTTYTGPPPPSSNTLVTLDPSGVNYSSSTGPGLFCEYVSDNLIIIAFKYNTANEVYVCMVSTAGGVITLGTPVRILQNTSPLQLAVLSPTLAVVYYCNTPNTAWFVVPIAISGMVPTVGTSLSTGVACVASTLTAANSSQFVLSHLSGGSYSIRLFSVAGSTITVGTSVLVSTILPQTICKGADNILTILYVKTTSVIAGFPVSVSGSTLTVGASVNLATFTGATGLNYFTASELDSENIVFIVQPSTAYTIMATVVKNANGILTGGTPFNTGVTLSPAPLHVIGLSPVRALITHAISIFSHVAQAIAISDMTVTNVGTATTIVNEAVSIGGGIVAKSTQNDALYFRSKSGSAAYNYVDRIYLPSN
jgi:hypothetical protein